MLAIVTVFQSISAILFAMFAFLMMAIILLQRGRGVGLAGAFGGAAGATAFGAKTGDLLTWVTIVMFGIYVLFAVILNYVFTPGAPSLAPSAPSISEPTDVPASDLAPSSAPSAPASAPEGGGAGLGPADLDRFGIPSEAIFGADIA